MRVDGGHGGGQRAWLSDMPVEARIGLAQLYDKMLNVQQKAKYKLIKRIKSSKKINTV
ncbi:hypothetical protein D3C78_1960480 [compost metagenome]